MTTSLYIVLFLLLLSCLLFLHHVVIIRPSLSLSSNNNLTPDHTSLSNQNSIHQMYSNKLKTSLFRDRFTTPSNSLPFHYDDHEEEEHQDDDNYDSFIHSRKGAATFKIGIDEFWKNEFTTMEHLVLLDNSSNNNGTNSTDPTMDLLMMRIALLARVCSYFELVFAALSFCFCIILMVAFVGLAELRGRKNFALIMAFLATEALSCVKHFLILLILHFPETIYEPNMCIVVAIFEYGFNFCSYCYGFCIVLDLLNVATNPIKGNKKKHIMYHICMWTLTILAIVGSVVESTLTQNNQACSILPDELYIGYAIYGINGIMAIIGIGICLYVWSSLRRGLPGTQKLRNGIIIRQCIFSGVIGISLLGTLLSSVILKGKISELKQKGEDFSDAGITIFTIIARNISIIVSSIEGLILSLILLSDPIILRHIKKFKDFLCMLTENDEGQNILDRIKKKGVIKSSTLYTSILAEGVAVDEELDLLSRRRMAIEKAKESLYHQRLLFEGIMDEGSEADQERFLKYLSQQDQKFFEDSLSNVAIDYMVRRDLIFCVLLATQHCMKQAHECEDIIKQFNYSESELTSHRNTLYGSPLMKKLFHPSLRSKTHPGLYNLVTKHKISVTEYYPTAFHHLRSYYFVDNLTGSADIHSIMESYKRSFEPTSVVLESVRNNFSEGKSGSFFLFTYDSQFMIKTINDDELKLLLDNIQFFYKHYTTFRDTFIVKIFGIYELKMTANFKIKFIVINNALNCRLAKDRGAQYDPMSVYTKFDLKGSWINRNNLPTFDGYANTLKFKSTSNAEDAYASHVQNRNKLLLDNDFTRKRKIIFENKAIYERFKQQLTIDSNFLKSLKIMDYSLLLGLAEDDPAVISVESLPNEIKFYEPFHKTYKGGIQVIDLDSPYNRAAIMYSSVIDILQLYDMNKKMETLIKTKILRKDPNGISSVEPISYAERFQNNVLAKFTSREDFYNSRSSSISHNTLSNRGLSFSHPRSFMDEEYSDDHDEQQDIQRESSPQEALYYEAQQSQNIVTHLLDHVEFNKRHQERLLNDC
ncbi:phosphatidylinositol-4-phosphate 5-kinase family protein [Naegleria gruberi]|uniref:Phosphatidylinositol-4-phosphate 5-kinase family protein n=1 Tax=Naegleria gruberi TaxID=5762 RepID=D2VZQ3_NAEGR|nr:phosphatidylinositol-4-phosphate 5-kinase family protein [Naegleria gruberi]EFC37737.1 phosphatidylinositol-4-phosphate 5-kinase family protein [Naegleria gruberi]|eukprot:XP_002670481.1 phosphatidylinositol-4-phosphate 5-kinase family protein [Naegleria gruberi strain NEG-M]